MRQSFASVLGSAWICLATTANAYSFNPPGAHFASAGKMNLSSGGFGAACTTTFEGVTDAGGAGEVTSAVFSGGLFGVCNALRPIGLPWTITLLGRNRAAILGVEVKSPLIGDCGPGDVAVAVSDGGVIRFGRVPLRPKCQINGGVLITKPTMAIVDR